jgi:pimeloyl-ACP methyl ester carboxylesterase
MQGLRSWYIAFFHLPVLPTVMWHTVMGPHWSRWLRWLERTPAEQRAGQTADGVRGMRLYRANMLSRMLRPGDRHAHAPVQVIVPLRDRYVGPALSDPAHLARWVPQLHRVEVDAGHWLPLQQPALFARLVRGFVRRVERQRRQTAGQRIKA